MKKYLAGLVILGLIAGASLIAQEKPVPPQAPRAKAAPAAPGQRGQMPLERLKTALGLTDEQVAKIEAQRKARQESAQAFRTQMQKLRGELGPMLRDPKADVNKAGALIDQIAKLGADQAKKGLQERGALEKILTPEQLTKLQGMPGLRMALRGGGMGPGFGMGMRGMGPGLGMRGRGPGMMGRGGMMMGRGYGRGMGQGMGMRGRGMGFGPNFRLRMQRLMRGWRWDY